MARLTYPPPAVRAIRRGRNPRRKRKRSLKQNIKAPVRRSEKLPALLMTLMTTAAPLNKAQLREQGSRHGSNGSSSGSKQHGSRESPYNPKAIKATLQALKLDKCTALEEHPTDDDSFDVWAEKLGRQPGMTIAALKKPFRTHGFTIPSNPTKKSMIVALIQGFRNK